MRLNTPNVHRLCDGLTESQHGWKYLCLTGTWCDATVAVQTAIANYNRAMTSLAVCVNDFAALLDTHTNQYQTESKAVSNLLSYHGTMPPQTPELVDVMRPYRTLIEESLAAIVDSFP